MRDRLILMAIVLLSRYLFRSHYLYDMDSVNFALGLSNFSPLVHQPHPPGYFLYEQLGRLAQCLFADANDALVAISILASLGLVVIIYELTRDFFGKESARIAGLIFIISPLAWFHGVVALTYVVEAFFSGLFGLFCWKIYKGQSQMIIPASFVLGLTMGIRQSAILFLVPLWVFSLLNVSWKNKILAILVFTFTVSLWFLIMLKASGGAEVYFGALSDLWTRLHSGDESLPLMEWLKLSLSRAQLSILAYAICFGVLAPLLFMPSLSTSFKPGLKAFILTWIIPGMLFFTFIFFPHNNLGYMLFLFVPLFPIIANKTFDWSRIALISMRGKAVFIVLFSVINISFFLFIPLYISYRSITQFENQLTVVQETINKVANPIDTVIIGLDAHTFGFRHAGYYLPEYLVLQYPEMKFAAGERIFVMHNRNTQLLSSVNLSKYKKFVVFNYVSKNSQDRAYIKALIEKFPLGAVSVQYIDGHAYVMGSVAYLSILFPKTLK